MNPTLRLNKALLNHDPKSHPSNVSDVIELSPHTRCDDMGEECDKILPTLMPSGSHQTVNAVNVAELAHVYNGKAALDVFCTVSAE